MLLSVGCCVLEYLPEALLIRVLQKGYQFVVFYFKIESFPMTLFLIKDILHPFLVLKPAPSCSNFFFLQSLLNYLQYDFWRRTFELGRSICYWTFHVMIPKFEVFHELCWTRSSAIDIDSVLSISIIVGTNVSFLSWGRCCKDSSIRFLNQLTSIPKTGKEIYYSSPLDSVMIFWRLHLQ